MTDRADPLVFHVEAMVELHAVDPDNPPTTEQISSFVRSRLDVNVPFEGRISVRDVRLRRDREGDS